MDEEEGGKEGDGEGEGEGEGGGGGGGEEGESESSAKTGSTDAKATSGKSKEAVDLKGTGYTVVKLGGREALLFIYLVITST